MVSIETLSVIVIEVPPKLSSSIISAPDATAPTSPSNLFIEFAVIELSYILNQVAIPSASPAMSNTGTVNDDERDAAEANGVAPRGIVDNITPLAGASGSTGRVPLLISITPFANGNSAESSAMFAVFTDIE